MADIKVLVFVFLWSIVGNYLNVCKLETTKTLDCQSRTRRQEANDENFKRNVPTALQGGILQELHYVKQKVKSFLPLIPQRQTEEQRVKDGILCDGKFTNSSTSPQQLMPRGFRQFWSHQKSSLAIQALKGCQDIDTFSIEIIKEHNEPHVVLPSLAKKRA